MKGSIETARQLKEAVVYVNSVFSPENDSGAYGAITVLKWEDGEIERVKLAKAYKLTKANRMRIKAVIAGLRPIFRPTQVQDVPTKVSIFSDQEFIFDSIDVDLVREWRNWGWKTEEGNPITNVELWKVFLMYGRRHVVKARWANEPEELDTLRECALLAERTLAEEQLFIDVGFDCEGSKALKAQDVAVPELLVEYAEAAD